MIDFGRIYRRKTAPSRYFKPVRHIVITDSEGTKEYLECFPVYSNGRTKERKTHRMMMDRLLPV